ncbi:alpha/beta hydrolase [Novosphingobium flavum]|uniref:Alpha/beta hydrolase n=1 Tax=Novosphingobium flavum TaxID=1778672 RepID=A0A7X1FS90_9SPHN|nr:alpha/beta hydrolase [Novosphingobium flavum]MBC2666048.1 alpha/beta hydrolase [Novosphingobium flavum]
MDHTPIDRPATFSTTNDPLILIIPGLGDSGPQHWQSHWERERSDCHRVDLGMWDNPHRNTWVNKLNLAIERAQRPVVLVAHSLGCLAVAWWAEYERPGPGHMVTGALLVAPPDVDRPGLDPRVARFGAAPRRELPFEAWLVASSNDPWCARTSAVELARDWGCRFVDAGAVGHINADSGLGDWAFGKRLLQTLLPGPSAAQPGGPRRPVPARPSLAKRPH